MVRRMAVTNPSHRGGGIDPLIYILYLPFADVVGNIKWEDGLNLLDALLGIYGRVGVSIVVNTPRNCQ